MSSVKLNPAIDLGLGSDYKPQDDGIESLAGITVATDVKAPVAPKTGTSLNGIIDINAAKPVPVQPQTDTQAKGMIETIATQKAAEKPVTTPVAQVQPGSDNGSQVILIAALVMFLISLAATAYFLFKYFA